MEKKYKMNLVCSSPLKTQYRFEGRKIDLNARYLEFCMYYTKQLISYNAKYDHIKKTYVLDIIVDFGKTLYEQDEYESRYEFVGTERQLDNIDNHFIKHFGKKNLEYTFTGILNPNMQDLTIVVKHLNVDVMSRDIEKAICEEVLF